MVFASHVPRRTGATRRSSFRSDSVAINVPKPRQKRHLAYFGFAFKHQITKEIFAKIVVPLPPFRRRRRIVSLCQLIEIAMIVSPPACERGKRTSPPRYG